MSSLKVEEVFKVSGIPTYTFVEPLEYTNLGVALRTPGRGVVIEGPSGIGKTTAVSQALAELNLEHTKLSARKPSDLHRIKSLPSTPSLGVVIIDDFHRLDQDTRLEIAEYLKVLADEESTETKLVIVGINKVGDSLVALAYDLNTRVETIRFEANTDELVEQLVTRGEKALNVHLSTKAQIVEAANGSFCIAQMLCHRTCIAARVTDGHDVERTISSNFKSVTDSVMETQSRRFAQIARRFASGPKLHREGRAPYLHILKWLAEGNEWSVSLGREMASHPAQRGSVGQVVEKDYLRKFLDNHEEFADVLHYEASTRVMTVEDPQFVFYLRNLDWDKFAAEVGYVGLHFQSRYDFALSFAGEDRPIASRLYDLLSKNEFEVFYDHNEQPSLLAEDLEAYLSKIYRSKASYVICLLGPEYPRRVWTKFESQQFKTRFANGGVIPVWFKTAPPGAFDESTRVGGYTLDPNANIESQLKKFVDWLKRKMEDQQLKSGA